VWTTDSAGNFVTSTAALSGSDASLQSYETTFQQDLNGDGRIGPPPPTVIESAGVTSLAKSGNTYFLFPVGGSSGPQLTQSGAPVVTGQFGAWAPVGGEQVTGGYRVVWANGSNQYSVWTTDSAGNFVTSTAALSGSDPGLQSYETTFQQDLNGDGRIGPSLPTVIESAGATDFVQVGSNYFLYPHLGSSGPELSYNGTAVTVGQFAGWTPLGVEKTASADGQYNIAWKSGNQFKFWVTDSNGNYLGESPVVSGTDAEMPGRENFFRQDLNSDGHVGTLAAS
jgi:serralysin